MECCSDYLIYCVRESDDREIKRLIAKGVNVNEKDCDGVTPLWMACGAKRPSVKIVTFLLNAGAKMNTRVGKCRCKREKGECFCLPFSIALKKGNKKILSLLAARSQNLQYCEIAAVLAAASPTPLSRQQVAEMLAKGIMPSAIVPEIDKRRNWAQTKAYERFVTKCLIDVELFRDFGVVIPSFLRL